MVPATAAVRMHNKMIRTGSLRKRIDMRTATSVVALRFLSSRAGRRLGRLLGAGPMSFGRGGAIRCGYFTRRMTNLTVLLTGLLMGESPRWHGDRLWFCDFGAQEVKTVQLDGKSEIVLRLPTLGINWLPNGRLLWVSMFQGLLLAQGPDGSLTTYADLTSISTKPWNELVVDGRGNAYVNNIGFNFPGGEFAPGIIAMVTPDGHARQVADGLAFPNGMVVTPDNATLIVAESYASRLTAFDIAPDGSRLTNRRTWAEIDKSAPDGICLDAENAIWYADVPNKRCVRVREGGANLQTIEVDRGCFACVLGGADRRTLFIMAADWRGPSNIAGGSRNGQILTARAPAAGVGWP